MTWKTIGQSVIGTSHLQNGKNCEDAGASRIHRLSNGEDVLVCFASDGAGSAAYAAEASTAAVSAAHEFTEALLQDGRELTDGHLIALGEYIYDRLVELAAAKEVPKNEFSCTLLGCIITPKKSGFVQIGDGAIVRNDGSGHFTQIWWPYNGEYQNSTAFIIDDPSLALLQYKVIDEPITEIAIFTDGLQQLALNHVSMAVHQPFFAGLFPALRRAENEEHLSILNSRLADYLSGDIINNRTDDDKTLLLATRE
ncbi:PP2C family serine/threonine-protein phosphatase [uncultured Mucilaginibacter sp.]|uniref:PP2C family serine/threonine-protein phosphatase n=1 Tax=uncultured Mucilaginibacter sp. TaxID=797541 RepID=UPI0025CC90C7|nr:PP2C family serine/threonine-protein phosphatase [uncultured Mucilaginibacter sp.]